MKRGRLKAVAVAASLSVVLALAPGSASADGNSNLHLFKFVDPVQLAINPNIGVTLAVDKTKAIPGDKLTYTSVVTNPTAGFGMGGYFNASSTASADATVRYYWDELEYCGSGFDCGNGASTNHWVPVATFENGQPGYVPVTPPLLHSGMTLAAQPVSRSGVTYPTTGDLVLGTVIKPKAMATWTYLAKVTLTPAQMNVLSNPAIATYVRNVLHVEVTVRNLSGAQPATDPEVFTSPFTSTTNPGAIHNITVTFTLPDGTMAAVGPAAVPALGLLSPGASATATATYTVPAPGPRATGESEADYATRLGSLDGLALKASSVASGTGFSGTVYATSPSVTTIENVPIVTISKSGPATVTAGTTETNPLAVSNIGGATAVGITVDDSVPGGGHGTVSGVPASLAAGASAPPSAAAVFQVPVDQADGNLADTATVTWNDANGNAYGSFTSSFTTAVRNPLIGARLTLAPITAGPNTVGTTQQLTATLVDRDGNPLGGQTITLAITGANPGTLTATTAAGGDASFTYTGNNGGNDIAQATFTSGSITLTSNTSSISWGKPLQPVTTSVVDGNFFPNPNNTCTFGADPTSTPAFTQQFPDILFNPPNTAVPHDISTVGTFTRPFTDLTVDVNGNYNGEIVAQGQGQQAGSGTLENFYAELTGTFAVNQPGDLTFAILHDDGYIIGVGGSATRLNGDLEGSPPANTPFNGYPVVAAFNGGSSGGSSSGTFTVHFPAAGVYPYELDYTECGSGALFLVLQTAKFLAQTDPLSVYVGYADGLRPGGSVFPFPWQGSPNVIFQGGGCCDNGAIRFDNSGTDPIVFDSIVVDIGPNHYDLWPRNTTLPPGEILILTGTSGENFDSSDTTGGCNQSGFIPAVRITRGGVTTTFNDTMQVLNTGGVDQATCTGGNESRAWTRIGGGGTTINIPLPPGASLNISPFKVANAVVGQDQQLTVSAMDGAGNPVANLPVMLQVFGVNTQALNATTLSTGLATFHYVGSIGGTDSITASAFVGGLHVVSNTGSVTWTGPGGTNGPPPPSITSPSPADGTVVTKPVAVDASIAPPSGATITSWRVFYQALDPGPQVVFASGTGTPPDPLGTFDPTVLPNDTYAITVEATASNGGVQDVTTTVSVVGNLKSGRYVTSYQDLVVPVGGFQIQVLRTYDSIDKSPGDFGTGWKIDIANFRVAANHVLGLSGWTQYNKSCVLGLCFTAFRNSAPRDVTVTFPDQHTEIFDFTPDGGTNLFWECKPLFTADTSQATTSTLEPIDDTSCNYTGDGNLYGSNGPYNPHQFKLTTRDGRVLILDATLGLISENDAFGNTLTVGTNGVTSTLGPASSPTPGPSITYQRDGQGRITDIVGPLPAQHLRYAYFGSGPNELQTFTDADGNVTTFNYDASTGNLASAVGPNSTALQTLHYDQSGRLISIQNGSQPPTSISTAAGAQQQTLLDPNGKLTTVMTYDDRGDIIERDDSFNGKTIKTTYTYDLVGRLTGITDPLLHSATITYNESATPANGNLLSVSANGRTWSLENYNSFGEPGLIRQPDGSVLVTIAYDAHGEITAAQAPGQAPTTFTYFANGQLQTVTDPGGRVTSYTYDANGNPATISDGQNITRVSFDSAGILRSVTDEAGNQTSLDYYPDGSLRTVTDGNQHSSQYFYDGLLRLTQAEDPLGKSLFYQYDDVGNLKQRTDRNGAVTTFGYDVDNNLTRVTAPNNDIKNYNYDPLSRLIEADNAASHIDRTYDDADRITSDTTCANTGASTTPCSAAPVGNQPTVTLSYTYFDDDQLKAENSSDPAVPGIQYGYDGLGRLASIKYGSQSPFALTYDNLGRLHSVARPNGIVDTYSYNASSDLTGRDSTLNGNTVARFDYTYDPFTGQRTSLTDNTGTHNYTYFANGWLKTATHPSGSGLANESYTYDAAGNRSSGSSASTYDANDRLLSDGVFNYSYDNEGDLTAKTPVGGGNGTTYSWDALHNLIGITYPDGTASSYRYDPLGRRVAAVDKGTETRFLNDGSKVAADYNSQNQVQSTYLSSLESVAGGQARYYLSDGVGSVHTLTDSAGAVSTTYSYDSFGLPASANALSAPESFAGYRYDATSGLYFAGARYYDPATGRFLSEDPAPALNPYFYAANDPVNLYDVNGLDAAAEYGEILSDESDAAICEAGFVGAVAGPSLEAAGAALTGDPVAAAEVIGAMAEGVAANSAQCAAGAATKRYNYPRAKHSQRFRNEVFDSHIEKSTGRVRDPQTGRFVGRYSDWQMGHVPGHEFSSAQESFRSQGLPPEEWRSYQRDPSIYRPELPSSNQNHKLEASADEYLGP
jgi:RHS repeat-associated protein